MSEFAIVFTRPPHGSASGREGLDLALMAGTYEVPTAVYFVGDGVFQLVKNQTMDAIDSKDYIATFGALPLYDVDPIRVCQQSLNERGLEMEDIVLQAELCSPTAIATYLNQADQVFTF